MSDPILRKGDTGSSVTECQELLTAHLFPTKADGVFGSGTQANVISFQMEKGLAADGIVGQWTWEFLREPAVPKEKITITFSQLASFFSDMLPQTYTLHGAECPSDPPGVSLKNLGSSTTNCVQFLGYILSTAFNKWHPSVKFSGNQWKLWMCSGDNTANPPIVPNWSPRVMMEWDVGFTSPGPGPILVQYFTETSGHNVLVVRHCQETDKILTLEATNVSKLNGAGWREIGNLRDVLNPGPNWRDHVSQTWESRFGSTVALHQCRLAITGVQEWLEKG